MLGRTDSSRVPAVLAIAQSIVVDKCGGRLTFDSAPGAGTRFRIELPLARELAAAAS